MRPAYEMQGFVRRNYCLFVLLLDGRGRAADKRQRWFQVGTVN
jgi:hypothetical protein